MSHSARVVTLPRDKVSDPIIKVSGLAFPRVPEGIYEAVYVSHELARVFGTPKLFAHFRIVTVGPQFGVLLFRPYNVKQVTMAKRRPQKFEIGRRSDLFYELNLVGETAQIRPDRPSLAVFKNVALKVKVETVSIDYRQRGLPEVMRYSRIKRVIGISAGAKGGAR